MVMEAAIPVTLILKVQVVFGKIVPPLNEMLVSPAPLIVGVPQLLILVAAPVVTNPAGNVSTQFTLLNVAVASLFLTEMVNWLSCPIKIGLVANDLAENVGGATLVICKAAVPAPMFQAVVPLLTAVAVTPVVAGMVLVVDAIVAIAVTSTVTVQDAPAAKVTPDNETDCAVVTTLPPVHVVLAFGTVATCNAIVPAGKILKLEKSSAIANAV